MSYTHKMAVVALQLKMTYYYGAVHYVIWRYFFAIIKLRWISHNKGWNKETIIGFKLFNAVKPRFGPNQIWLPPLQVKYQCTIFRSLVSIVVVVSGAICRLMMVLNKS